MMFFMTQSLYAGQKKTANEVPPFLVGKVLEIVDTKGYTCVKIDVDGKEVWAAGPVTKVSVGEYARIDTNSLMQNFSSKTLNRTFEKIYFTTHIEIAKEKNKFPEIVKMSQKQYKEIQKLLEKNGSDKNSKTIADLIMEKENLENKTVVIYASVSRFSPGIDGKNWIYIKDGTEVKGKKEIPVITKEKLKSGQLVRVEGKVLLNKDYGNGLNFEMIIEAVKVELL